MNSLIFGGTSGIGKSTARILSALGKTVVAGRSRPQDSDYAEFIECDITDHNAVKYCIDKTYKLLGKIDIVVNSSGYGHCLAIDEISIEEWDKMNRVTNDGNFYIAKYTYEYFKKQKTGHFIIIGSMASGGGWRMEIGYGSLKGGQAKFGIHLNDQFKYDRQNDRGNFYCHVVCPGSVATKFWNRIPQRSIDVNQSLNPNDVGNLVILLVKNPEWGYQEAQKCLTDQRLIIDKLSPFGDFPFIIKIAHSSHG